MVAPAAGNLDVPAGVAFAREASVSDQRNRRRVPRLNVDLDSMQLQGAKAHPQRESESLAHVTSAGMFRESVIAQVSALKRPADNLAEVEYTDRRIVFSPANEHTDVRRMPGVARSRA